MTRRAWPPVLCCPGILLAVLSVGVQAQTRRPNVILLFPDQMRGQAMGCAGNDQVHTPHMNRLAGGGLRLPNTFANTPVCCPARATMLTGKYPHKHGLKINDLRLRESQVTIAELLSDAGYATGFIGKWHLDGGIRQPGFIPPGPRRQGFSFWGANECSHRHFDTAYFRDDPTPIPIKQFESIVWTDLAIEFVRANRDKPFFLMIGMGPPHNPYKAPPEYSRLYDPATLTMRPNWQPGTRLGSRKDIAEYYAMITAVDDNIGRLLGVLDALDLTADTLIIFTSDHGDMLGSQGMFLKRKPFEESIRVPGIIRYPRRIKPGQVRDTIAETDPSLTDLDRLHKIHRGKTGALIHAACTMGAMCGLGTSHNPHDPREDHNTRLAAIGEYADAVGLMFQIVDDLLDVEHTAEQTGKRTRKDASAGKLTFPGLLGVEASRREIERLRAASVQAVQPLGSTAKSLGAIADYLASRTR